MLRTARFCSRNQFRNPTAEPYVLSWSMTREGTICRDSLGRPFFLKRFCADAGLGLVIIDIASGSLDGSTGGKNSLIRTAPKFFHGRPDCIFMDPAFHYQYLCIDAVGRCKKGINAFKKESAGEQKSGSQDQPATQESDQRSLRSSRPHNTRRGCGWCQSEKP